MDKKMIDTIYALLGEVSILLTFELTEADKEEIGFLIDLILKILKKYEEE